MTECHLNGKVVIAALALLGKARSGTSQKGESPLIWLASVLSGSHSSVTGAKQPAASSTKYLNLVSNYLLQSCIK